MEDQKEYFPDEEIPAVNIKVTKRRFGPQGGHKTFEIYISMWEKEDVPYKACRKNRNITIISKRTDGQEDLWRCMGFWFFYRWIRLNCANGRTKVGAVKMGKRVNLPLGFSYTRQASIVIDNRNLEDLIQNANME